MVIFIANFNNVDWKLPSLPEDMSWNLILDSSLKMQDAEAFSGKVIKVPGWSVLVYDTKK